MSTMSKLTHKKWLSILLVVAMLAMMSLSAMPAFASFRASAPGSSGSSRPGGALRASSAALVASPQVASGSVTLSVSGAAVTATASGITSPYYMFAYSQNGTTWQYGPYGASNTLNLNSRGLAAGNWYVMAFALASGDSNWGDGVWSAASVVTVSENITVAVSNTTVSATTVGITSPWYLFFYSPVGATLNWSATAFSQNTNYTFSSLAPGSYYVVGYALDGADATASPVNWNNGIYAPFVTITVAAVQASVSAINPTIAIGGTTTFQFENAAGTVVTSPSNVTWAVTSSNASTGFINSSGTFTATAAGTYTVTATFSGTTLTATVTVTTAANLASSVTLTPASTSFAADSAATDTITVQAVDANGNILTSYTGAIDIYLPTSTTGDSLSVTGSTGSGTLGSPFVLDAVNGAITAKVTSGGTTVGSDTIYAGIPNSSGTVTTWESTTVKAVAQVATSVGAAAATSASVAASTSMTSPGSPVIFEILDQNGNPMVPTAAQLAAGTVLYAGTVTISGPAVAYGYNGASGYITSGSSVGVKFLADANSSLIDSGSTSTAGADIYEFTFSAASSTTTGAVTLTPAVSGLTSVPITITFTNPGLASQVVLSSQPTTTSFTADKVAAAETTLANALLSYKLQAEDATGLVPSGGLPTNVAVQVAYNGAPATKVGVWNTTTTAYTATTSSLTTTPTVTVSSTTGAATVSLGLIGTSIAGTTVIPDGTYTVTITPAAVGTTTFTALTETFTVTAGKAYTLAVTPASTSPVTVAAGGTEPISAQVLDSWGNNVSLASVVVDFAGVIGSTLAPVPSLLAASTNASGVVAISATIGTAGSTTEGGDNGHVTAVIDSSWATSNGVTVAGAVSSGTITIGTSTAGSVVITLGQTTPYTASATVPPTFTAVAYSASGAPLTDTLTYGLTGPTGFTSVLSGTPVATALPDLTIAGSYTLTVTDTSAVGEPSATATITVIAGAVSGAAFFNSNGLQPALGFPGTANTRIAVTLDPVDGLNNPTTYSVSKVVAVSATPSGGAFYLTATGGTPVTSVTIPAFTSSVPLYYINAAAGPYLLAVGAITTPTTTPATLVSAAVTAVPGAQLVLTYSGALSPASSATPPVAADYTVTVAGANDTVTKVVVSGDTVTLTLTAAVSNLEQDTTVAYATTTNPLTDANGYQVAAFGTEIVSVS